MIVHLVSVQVWGLALSQHPGMNEIPEISLKRQRQAIPGVPGHSAYHNCPSPSERSCLKNKQKQGDLWAPTSIHICMDIPHICKPSYMYLPYSPTKDNYDLAFLFVLGGWLLKAYAKEWYCWDTMEGLLLSFLWILHTDCHIPPHQFAAKPRMSESEDPLSASLSAYLVVVFWLGSDETPQSLLNLHYPNCTEEQTLLKGIFQKVFLRCFYSFLRKRYANPHLFCASSSCWRRLSWFVLLWP